MNKALIHAQSLTKRYPTQKTDAITGLDFSIPRGQLYGLVGPDGAGKTTTLRILSTVMEQSSGSASIAGCDVKTGADKARHHIGYMPQNFSLYPDLSVIENLNFFANLHAVPPDRKDIRIPELLAFSRLDRFRSRRAGKLSGGMKKKLALACALVHDPDVLLLDEPSTGVDPVSRRELWVILAEVVQRGVAVLVSTPYMDEAERCHRVGVLYRGELLTSGAPEDLEAGLPYDIVEVKARPRKEMRRVVERTDGIVDWRPVGDRLRLTVPNTDSNAKRVIQALKSGFKREGLDVSILRQTKTTMEDVFVHLVAGQRGVA
ncbi:MAG: ABC transporter ATP-binding protein [Chloroflexi bacterium]|nr:ABC transporter ATP-binding protein [Chloroflexota bacterium]MBU1661404.1 ABC transporter ATP-binding protein [Chloroflexota bacterium]